MFGTLLVYNTFRAWKTIWCTPPNDNPIDELLQSNSTPKMMTWRLPKLPVVLGSILPVAEMPFLAVKFLDMFALHLQWDTLPHIHFTSTVVAGHSKWVHRRAILLRSFKWPGGMVKISRCWAGRKRVRGGRQLLCIYIYMI